MHSQWMIFLAISTGLSSAYSLPPPTGKYQVALAQHVIRHNTPNDPLAPDGKATSFLVNLWYPTLQAPGYTKRAAYDGPLATLYEDYFAAAYNISDKGALKNVTTNIQYPNARVLPSERGTIKLPTLLFQPPFTGPPSQAFTSLLSDLASKGYTIVALDHPYEQPFIQYPSGGPGFYGPPVTYEGNVTVYQKYNAIRIADARAFLNAWPSLIAQHRAQKVFNASHFIAFGHSIGGSASIGELLELQGKKYEFLGGINLDGTLFGRAFDDTSAIDTKRPTLFMASTHETDPTWTNYGAQQTSWWRFFQVDGTVHTDYSDLVLWKQWFGITKPGPEKIEATRMVHLVRTWVAAFIEKVTSGSQSTLVEGPSAKWPEVKLIMAKN